MAALPGWYGKLPSLGDFVGRRLPPAFVDRWDNWLQDVLQATRQRFGPQWSERYLVSPIWRFACAPGVIDDRIWTGVMMPSVDSANRYFPLTIAQAHAGFDATELRDAPLLTAWDRMATAALEALQNDLTPDQLDQQLASGETADGAAPPSSALVSLIRDEAPCATLWFADGSDRVSLSHVFDRLPAGDQAVVLIDDERSDIVLS